jgi:hypothetical protein
MADYVLSGYTTEASVAIPATNQLGRTFGSSTSDFDIDGWNGLRAGTEYDSITISGNDLRIDAFGSSAPLMTINRVFLQFAIPDNLSRLDDTPQLQVFATSIFGDATVVPVSVDYTNFTNPWTSNNAVNAFQSVQTGAGAKYIDGSSVTISIAAGPLGGLNTITLNELAKYHLIFGGASSSGVRYLTIALMNYTYDWAGALPPDAVANTIFLQDASDANPPILILRKPWFINDKGDEFAVDGDYTIRANTVGVNQFDRSVPQLPFSQNIRGPRSLRGKNVPYKVTS